MFGSRKYEVHGEDANGDVWIVASALRDTAEHIAEKFRRDGYKNVKIIEK